MSLILRSIGPVRAAAGVLAAAAFQLLIECSKALSQAWTERLLDYLTSGKEPVKGEHPSAGGRGVHLAHAERFEQNTPTIWGQIFPPARRDRRVAELKRSGPEFRL